MEYMKHNNVVAVVNKPNVGSLEYRYMGAGQNIGYDLLSDAGTVDYTRTYGKNTLWKSASLNSITYHPRVGSFPNRYSIPTASRRNTCMNIPT